MLQQKKLQVKVCPNVGLVIYIDTNIKRQQNEQKINTTEMWNGRMVHSFGLKAVCLNLQCSAECGMGVRTRAVVCLTNQVSSLPLEGCGSERPATSQVCNNGHCEQRIEWFTGPWSQVRGGYRVTLGSRESSLDQPAMWNITVNLHGLRRICFTFFVFFALNNKIYAGCLT